MTYLLDTHVFMWATFDTKKLSAPVRKVITDKNNDIHVSTVSFWEISLKTSIDKFSLDNIDIRNFPKYAKEMGFATMNMEEQESITFANLPVKNNHKDPFDRMIIWQAIVKNMILISKDRLFEQYRENGLQLMW